MAPKLASEVVQAAFIEARKFEHICLQPTTYTPLGFRVSCNAWFHVVNYTRMASIDDRQDLEAFNWFLDTDILLL
jgi:hypothetical protein